MVGLALLLSIIAISVAGAAAMHASIVSEPQSVRTCLTHGHRYEARYHTVPTLKTLHSSDPYTIERVMKASEHRTYVHDICVYCGDTKAIV